MATSTILLVRIEARVRAQYMRERTELLIVGAGPFGLAMAAYAGHLQIDFRIVGRPMEFWENNMPKGMILRSNCDWHLDPLNVKTIEYYLKTRHLTREEVEPIPLEFYLEYAQWFQMEKEIRPLQVYVDSISYKEGNEQAFLAKLENGDTIIADNVVMAVGFKYFKLIPHELSRIFPPGRIAHTCDLVNFEQLSGKRCLIIGGRQSAFEWAALIQEAGAKEVHIVHRSATPKFATSDWTWVTPLMDGMADNPGWFRSLSHEEREGYNARMYAEGRLKIEPWLEERIRKKSIHVWPNTRATSAQQHPDGEIAVNLDNGNQIKVDQVILATGYSVNITKIPFLAESNIIHDLATAKGFPLLDEHFQTNIPGLYATSMMATRDFGSFFAFTVSARAAAQVIGDDIRQRCSHPPC